MTAKGWRSYIRSLAKVSRPDDMEEKLLADLAAAEARVEALEKALEKYGWHLSSPMCPVYWGEKDEKCTCGLDAALGGTR